MTPAGRAAGRLRVFVACVGVAALKLPPTAARAADDAQQTLWVETTDADTENPALYILPEMRESRHLARVESLRCRLAIAEGRIDDAIAILRRQFMLARHLGQDEFVISGLVGVAAASMAVSDALELAQLPDAPNLYRACAAMPRPFSDPSRMLASERAMLYLVMKSLRDVDETPRPAEY